VAKFVAGEGYGFIETADGVAGDVKKRSAGACPLLADHLEEALSLFDRSCDDFEMGHL
jgi:hypothetical protein